jgi:hypothetical protein
MRSDHPWPLVSVAAVVAEYRSHDEAGLDPSMGVVSLDRANLGSREQSDPDEGDRALPRPPAWTGAIVWSPKRKSQTSRRRRESSREHAGQADDRV